MKVNLLYFSIDFDICAIYGCLIDVNASAANAGIVCIILQCASLLFLT